MAKKRDLSKRGNPGDCQEHLVIRSHISGVKGISKDLLLWKLEVFPTCQRGVASSCLRALRDSTIYLVTQWMPLSFFNRNVCNDEIRVLYIVLHAHNLYAMYPIFVTIKLIFDAHMYFLTMTL